MQLRGLERWISRVRRRAAGGRRAEAPAAEAETLRGDFVSLVSHEVRTPMAAVIGSARTLRQRWDELSADQRDSLLGLIADETERLAALVAEVFDSSRIDDGSFSYSFAEVDLGSLIGEIVASVGIGHGISGIAASVPADLPPVRGDAARLRQVLTNLIDNAVKYSPEGVPVEVRASAEDGRVAVSVVDRGAGIAPADQHRIFEKFVRLHGTASKSGSGLGLYIARAIAEAHGGTLEVTSSTLGEGSTFVLTLPEEAE